MLIKKFYDVKDISRYILAWCRNQVYYKTILLELNKL